MTTSTADKRTIQDLRVTVSDYTNATIFLDFYLLLARQPFDLDHVLRELGHTVLSR